MPLNPWDELCRCGHPLRRHRLDWNVETDEPDCDVCDCKDFEFPDPVGSIAGVPAEDAITGGNCMAAIGYDEMKATLRELRRQAEGLEDACLNYNASGSRANLEHIQATADKVTESARTLEEWHS